VTILENSARVHYWFVIHQHTDRPSQKAVVPNMTP